MRMAAAIYDMDKTVTRRPTYLRWLIFWSWRVAPWRLLLLPAVAVAGSAYAAGLASRDRLKEISQRLLMGDRVPRADVERIAAAFAEREVPRELMPGAMTQLAADRAAGLDIVMATASFDFYARAIAARLGIDHVVATRSVWDGDRLRARIEGMNCYGPAKLAMIEAALPGAAIARAYSDHVSDAPLLERAAVAVAVSPSAALRVLADRRNWATVNWH